MVAPDVVAVLFRGATFGWIAAFALDCFVFLSDVIFLATALTRVKPVDFAAARDDLADEQLVAVFLGLPEPLTALPLDVFDLQRGDFDAFGLLCGERDLDGDAFFRLAVVVLVLTGTGFFFAAFDVSDNVADRLVFVKLFFRADGDSDELLDSESLIS